MRALRYYEEIGLVVPARQANGYRDYQSFDVRLLQEVKVLTQLGLSVEQTRPFLECLSTGHEEADDCPASLATYHKAIREFDRRIEALRSHREALMTQLDRAASRGGRYQNPKDKSMTALTQLPDDLPVPVDDGAADHLAGLELPRICLPSTSGEEMNLTQLQDGRSVLYFYPLTGRPGVDLPTGWDAIPGARGCTAEACDFADHFAELRGSGVDFVCGVSSQTSDYQRELVERLRLPFVMLSDFTFALADALRMPTFDGNGQRLYRRLTLVVDNGRIEHVFYPVFPPNKHAGQVLAWLTSEHKKE